MSTTTRAQAPSRERIGDRVTIYKTSKSPNWNIQFNVDGQQVRRSLKTSSLKQARILARQYEAKLLLGQLEPSQRRQPTIAETVTEYLDALQTRGRNVKTIAAYNRDLYQFNAYLKSHGITRWQSGLAKWLEGFQRELVERGYQPPPRVTADSIGRRRGVALGARPLKPKSLRDKMKNVRSFMKALIKRGVLKNDPAAGYVLPADSKQQAVCWTREELARIFEHLAPIALDPCEFLRVTGLRIQEFCWLTKQDFDRQRRCIHVRAKTCPLTGRAWRPKFGKERLIPLCDQGCMIAERAAAASTGPWLFGVAGGKQAYGGQWTDSRLWTMLKRATRAAGVNKGTLHTFRHYYCSTLANARVPPFQVMKILGHDSLDIVLRYYHLNELDLLTAVQSVPFGTMLPPVGPADLAESQQTAPIGQSQESENHA